MFIFHKYIPFKMIVQYATRAQFEADIFFITGVSFIESIVISNYFSISSTQINEPKLLLCQNFSRESESLLIEYFYSMNEMILINK